MRTIQQWLRQRRDEYHDQQREETEQRKSLHMPPIEPDGDEDGPQRQMPFYLAVRLN